SKGTSATPGVLKVLALVFLFAIVCNHVTSSLPLLANSSALQLPTLFAWPLTQRKSVLWKRVRAYISSHSSRLMIGSPLDLHHPRFFHPSIQSVTPWTTYCESEYIRIVVLRFKEYMASSAAMISI